MRNDSTIKKFPTRVIALILELILFVLATIFFLAHGLDSNRFFISFDADICTLLASLAFPLYITVEFGGYFVLERQGYEVYPYPGEKHFRAVATSFLVSLVSFVVEIVAYAILHGNNAPLAVLFISICSLPGLLCYAGFYIVHVMKKEEVPIVEFLLPIFLALSALTFGGLSAGLGFGFAPSFGMFLIGMPLLCVILSGLNLND